MKGRWANYWNRLKAEAKQDNMTKARIAEQTVQHALAGIQEAVTLNPSLPEAERETPLTEDYVLAQYRGDGGKKRAGRLFVLRPSTKDCRRSVAASLLPHTCSG